MTSHQLTRMLMPSCIPLAIHFAMPLLIQLTFKGLSILGFTLIFAVLVAWLSYRLAASQGLSLRYKVICAICGFIGGFFASITSLLLYMFPDPYITMLSKPDVYPLLALSFIPGFIQSALHYLTLHRTPVTS